MNDELRQAAIEKLRRGEDLPTEWAREFFPPERREYELVYFGKEREEVILAETMAVPLQPVRQFGSDGTHWHNMLIFGDNLQTMMSLIKMKEQGRLVNSDGSHGVKLVYIDPPFATKQEFRGSREEQAYRDKVAGAQFIEFLRKRLVLLHELLSDNGSIYVHLDWRKGHYIKCILDEVFGEHRFANEIVWRATDPHNNVTKKYGNVHQTLYFYKMQDTSINMDDVREHLSASALKEYSLVERPDGTVTRYSPGLPGRRFKLNDATVPGADPEYQFEWRGAKPSKNRRWPTNLEGMERGLRDGIYYLRDPKRGRARCKKDPLDQNLGQVPQDIWDNCGTMKGGSSYPTEKPEELLARIVKASSSRDDIVLDAFAGSGTTMAVAEKLGRRWIGIDSGKLAIYTIQKRLLSLREEIGNKGRPLLAKPFTLYNAGLYDFSRLRKLPWQDWRFFALRLFGCKDEPHVVGGLHLDGKLRGGSVLVFNHLENPGKSIDEDTIRTIHAHVGDKVGNRFFIVAPRGVFDFQQDYITLDAVRYYALRIPYSVISDLHARPFTALEQPRKESAVNDMVDSWGFDFIKMPRVEWSAGITARDGRMFEEGFIRIEQFESYSRVTQEDAHGSKDTLAMLLLDLDYNGDVFDLDATFYEHQLETEDWKAYFPADEIGEKVMAVFIDIHGNEAREVIARDEFLGENSASSRATLVGVK